MPMARFAYPTRRDLELFVRAILKSGNPIGEFLPSTSGTWLSAVSDCIEYVSSTDGYTPPATIFEAAARLLYKCVKKHELTDGNKRSAVIAVYLFVSLNDHEVTDPAELKRIAKGVARTKGRANESAVCARIAMRLLDCVRPAQMADAA